jgi:hypothetical protein
MESKLLFRVGNLYPGYPYGVKVELDFGSTELHGPFNSENEANTYMHRLIETAAGYVGAKVVKIETPQAGRAVVLTDDGFQYDEMSSS